MATHSDQPGWRPDPAKPGTLRWWNGLDWSDAWRSAGEAVERERTALQTAARGSTISPEQVAHTVMDRRAERGAPSAVGAVTRMHPIARFAPVLGILGLIFGAYGIVSLVGFVVSLVGLVVSSRRELRARRSGQGASLIGLVLSGVGLLQWLPTVLQLLPGLQNALSS
ncbi:MAG TPA: DUF2510 domain-containing protein [Amnibacterium sp.]